VAVVSVALWFFFFKMDCDLTLLLAEKFGKPLSAFRGKVVWVTGASSGIGEAMAYILAKHGAKLIISGRNKQRLEEVKDLCIEKGSLADDILVLPFDVKDSSSHERCLQTITNHFGKLDILINNAGNSQRAAFEEVELDVDKEIFEINVFGPVSLTRVVLKYFYENNIKGQFAVTSSTAGIMGVPYSCSYTGSKHAINGYYECLRIESYNRGVRVTVLCPGPVFSRITENAMMGKPGVKVGESGRHPPGSRRMATSRCAQLCLISIINQLDQSWITIQPVLFMHYWSQYAPSLFRWFFGVYMTPERAKKVREGN